MALLEVRGLTVEYGGVVANKGIDLDGHPGKVVGLIGPNGAGKTTFIDAVTGFVAPTAGSVVFDARDVGRRSPEERAIAGLTRTFQSVELFEDLSVRDNLLVAAERPRWWSLAVDLVRPRRIDGRCREQVGSALELLALTELASAAPAELSHGQRKLVGVARAVAAGPRLILLDEPAAGLDTTESQRLGTQLRRVVDHGIGLVLVDHDMGLVMSLCDEIYVVDFGRIIAHGTPAEVRADRAVIDAYLGSAGTEAR